MIRIDIKSDVCDAYYRNEFPLPSSAISIIASSIDERVLKEISILCFWDSILIDSPHGEFSPWVSVCLRQAAPQRRSEAMDDQLALGSSLGGDLIEKLFVYYLRFCIWDAGSLDVQRAGGGL